MKKIILFAFIFISQLAFASTNEFDMDKLEYELDRAQYIQNTDTLIYIYTNICAQVSSSQLVRVEYDGANALFLTYAGLARAYLNADKNLTNGFDFAIRARKLGYETGVVATNPERFANHLHNLSLYYETPFSNKEKSEEYGYETLETSPFFTPDMIDVWRASYMRDYYDPWKARPVLEELISNTPFIDEMFYRNCGWLCTLQNDYRAAFRFWNDGLRDADMKSKPKYITRKMMEYIEYATLDELKETKQLLNMNAAKYPATIENVKDVIDWLRQADNPHLNFEIKLREAEESGDSLTVTNMLKEGLSRYRRPLYAEKLGDYDKLVELYCKRMKSQNRWWATPEYSLLPKIDKIIERGNVTTNTIKHYRDTLKLLIGRHPKRSESANLEERIKYSISNKE